jgi:hypothetical protein
MMYYVAVCKDCYLFAFAWFVNKVDIVVQNANISETVGQWQS